MGYSRKLKAKEHRLKFFSFVSIMTKRTEKYANLQRRRDRTRDVISAIGVLCTGCRDVSPSP
jgi:hypothetical protein